VGGGHRGCYNGGPFDSAASVAVSPDGAAVFVAGTSGGGGTDDHYATVAYSAAAGRQLWVSRFHANNDGGACCVSPVGAAVFVTGFSYGTTTSAYATVAYRV